MEPERGTRSTAAQSERPPERVRVLRLHLPQRGRVGPVPGKGTEITSRPLPSAPSGHVRLGMGRFPLFGALLPRPQSASFAPAISE
jgi:hypothetical protein